MAWAIAFSSRSVESLTPFCSVVSVSSLGVSSSGVGSAMVANILVLCVSGRRWALC